MHAGIEQLLNLRDAGPVDAAIKQHVSDCRKCSDELDRLRAVQASLRGLPQMAAPPESWERLQARLDNPPVRSGWKLAAVAASLAIAMFSGWVLLTDSPAPAPGARNVAVITSGPVVASVAAPEINELVVQSQRLEQLLRELDEPHVMNAGTAGTIAGLQEGIAVIDYGLSSQNDLSPGQSQQLWRQRVGLMNSLVQVRGAQLQQQSN